MSRRKEDNGNKEGKIIKKQAKKGKQEQKGSKDTKKAK
jgi:hypothetical protein